jgi:hypothetical protein
MTGQVGFHLWEGNTVTGGIDHQGALSELTALQVIQNHVIYAIVKLKSLL